MNPSDIYRKTPRGLEEMQNRALGLQPRCRTLLILLDGKTSVGTLMEKAPVVGELYEQLQRLQEHGLIELVSDTPAPTAGNVESSPAVPASASSTAASTPASGASAADLAAVKRIAIHALRDALGPEADAFTLKVENAATAAEFRALAATYRDAIRAAKGSQYADSFWNSVLAGLPE